MSTERDDPLEELVVSRERVNRQCVVDALDGVVNVSDDGELLKMSGFQPLNSRERIVALLLARWAAAELGLVDTPGLPVAELGDRVGLSASAVEKYVHEMVFVRQSSDGDGHSIPERRIVDAVQFVDTDTTGV